MKKSYKKVLIDYALRSARKFFRFIKKNFPNSDQSLAISETLFSVSGHPLSDYKEGITHFREVIPGLDIEETRLVLLLLGITLYQKNGVILWHIATYFHHSPSMALSFINRVLSVDSSLRKKNTLIVEDVDFSQQELSIQEITNLFHTQRVYLSPISLTHLFGLISGEGFLGFPVLKIKKKFQDSDDLLADINSLIKYLYFISNYYKLIYSPAHFNREDIYKDGEFAEAIDLIKNSIIKSNLKIELTDFLINNTMSNLEFVLLLYIINRVVINREFSISNIEELLNDLTFTAQQTKTILKCFSSDSLFVKENILDQNDYFTPLPMLDDEELDEMEQLFDREDFEDLPFDFNSISINKERVFRLIFTEQREEKQNLKNVSANADPLNELDKVDKDHERIRVKGLYEIQIPKVNLSNVILEDEVKKNLMGAVDMTRSIEVMKEWEVKPSLSANSYSSIKILLYGASGTGKTITAEALAGEADAELFKVDASNLVTSWVGESAKNVKKVFKEFYRYQKQTEKKVFMFFNEADQLLSARGAVMQAADKEYNQMQNILLEELENFDGVFLATTNLINLFDSAWNRRFNIKIKFEIPTYATRLKLWKVHIPEKLPLAPDVNIAKLAETELAGGSIANVVYNAARKAALREGLYRVVTQSDFMDAIKHEKNAQLGGFRPKVGFS